MACSKWSYCNHYCCQCCFHFCIKNLTLLPLGTTTIVATTTTTMWIPLLSSMPADVVLPLHPLASCGSNQNQSLHSCIRWLVSGAWGLRPSPGVGGHVSSDFLIGKTEEEFPQKQTDNSNDLGHWKMKKFPWNNGHDCYINDVNIPNTTELYT